jgi:hypothetical protein
MNRDEEEIEVNVDDLLDVINAERTHNAAQEKIDRANAARKTIDEFNVEVSVRDLLDLGVKPIELFYVIRQNTAG